MHLIQRRPLVALIAASCILGPGLVQAQPSWPDGPIRIIVPFAPGGIADLGARIIQPILQKELGQPIVIENKPGASGSLATDFVAHAVPDGYTLLLALAAPQTLNQYIYKVNYDGLKDFAPITLINTNPMVLMANPSLPVNTVKELIAYAKQNPGKLNFAGAGGFTQFSGEIFKHMAGVDMVHVPYRGGAPAVAAAAAGEVQRPDMDELRAPACHRAHERPAVPPIVRDPDHCRSRAARLRGDGLERFAGTSRYSTGDRGTHCSRYPQGVPGPSCAQALGEHRGRARRQFTCGIPRDDPVRHAEVV
jgi:hypothetical protein